MERGLFFFSDSTFSIFLTGFGVEDVDGASVRRLFGVLDVDKTDFENPLLLFDVGLFDNFEVDKFSFDFLKFIDSEVECGVLVYGQNVFEVFLSTMTFDFKHDASNIATLFRQLVSGLRSSDVSKSRDISSRNRFRDADDSPNFEASPPPVFRSVLLDFDKDVQPIFRSVLLEFDKDVQPDCTSRPARLSGLKTRKIKKITVAI